MHWMDGGARGRWRPGSTKALSGVALTVALLAAGACGEPADSDADGAEYVLIASH